MKVMSIVGARPQFVKLAPISAEFKLNKVNHVIVHTGQHYDSNMSDIFFDSLSIPTPNFNLGIGSGSHGHQTAGMLTAIEDLLLTETPDWVLVFGDTNSTLAASLASRKIGQPLAHLEAGLRSFNRAMPEEVNRVLTDHCSDLLLAPTVNAMNNLEREGLLDRSRLVGDVMVDICRTIVSSQSKVWSPWPGEFVEPGTYLLSTLHRAENTDNETRLRAIIETLQAMPLKVFMPVHPRLRERCIRFEIELRKGNLVPLPPLAYPDMMSALVSCKGLITDSGGLQKEAYILAKTCTTIRSETEWVETLHDGWNVLTTDMKSLGSVAMRESPNNDPLAHFGNGFTSSQVLELLSSEQVHSRD